MRDVPAQIFRIRACRNQPVDHDWQAQLASLLGSKPRRLSRWCELGLFGALACIGQTGQRHLSNQVAIRIDSESGTLHATRAALAQANEHLPMPFTFMQTQPSQLFHALGTALNWHGAGYTTCCSRRAQRDAMLLLGIGQAALLGRVDEEPALVSHWIWLEKISDLPPLSWRPAAGLFAMQPDAGWLKVEAGNRFFQSD